jgi:hypothetical protein
VKRVGEKITKDVYTHSQHICGVVIPLCPPMINHLSGIALPV